MEIEGSNGQLYTLQPRKKDVLFLFDEPVNRPHDLS